MCCQKLPANMSGQSLDMLSLSCLVTCVCIETWSDAQMPLKRTKSHVCCQTRSHFSCLYKEAILTIVVWAFAQRWGCVKRREVLETVGSGWVSPDAKLKYLACLSGACKKTKNSPKLFYYSTDFYIRRTFLKESPQLFSSPLFFLHLFFSLSLLFALPLSFIPSQPTQN